MSKTGFVPSIKESELEEGQMKPVRVKGRPILLVRQDGEEEHEGPLIDLAVLLSKIGLKKL